MALKMVMTIYGDDGDDDSDADKNDGLDEWHSPLTCSLFLFITTMVINKIRNYIKKAVLDYDKSSCAFTLQDTQWGDLSVII